MRWADGRRLRRVPIAVLMVSILMASACGSDDSSSDGAAGGTAGGTAEPIKLGVTTALTGPYAAYGIPLSQGVHMAVEQINAAGGVEIGVQSRTIEVVELDTRSDVNTAVATTTQLIRDDDVQYIIGPATGVEAIATQELTQRQDVVQFSSASQLQTVLTEESVKEGGEKRHLFMTQASDEARETAVVAAVNEALDNPKVQGILIGNDSNGQFIGPILKKQIEASGATVPEIIYYEPGTTDYAPYLTRIRAMNVDVLHAWWLPTDTMNILDQAVVLDVAPAYAPFNIEPAELQAKFSSADAPMITTCTPICRTASTSDESSKFWAGYEEFLGGDEFPSAAGTAVWYFEATLLLADAWEKAGTVDDTDAVVTALEGMERPSSTGTPWKYDSRHMAVHGFDGCAVQGDAEPTCQHTKPKSS